MQAILLPVRGRRNELSRPTSRCAARRLQQAPSRRACPEPAPSPGPGHVLAPIWKTRSTGVRCPGWRANGRQRKFWSSASEPEYGSPRSRLMFASWRSAGDSTTRCRIEDSRFGMCARNPRLDPVGVALAQRLVPRAVPDVELAGRVAFTCHGSSCSWIQRMPFARGSARVVDRKRLSDDDRRLGGQQTTLCLIDGSRDPVEPGREMNDRGACRDVRHPPSAAAPTGRSESASRSGRNGNACRLRRSRPDTSPGSSRRP